MLFQDFNENVLADILGCCDVSTVLAFTGVNKHHRDLALSKQLWIGLVRDLARRGTLDLLPEEDDLGGYSTEDLINKVKYVVLGPQTWRPGSPAPASLKRVDIIRFGKGIRRDAKASLLAGGRYAVVWVREESLEVWNVTTSRCVWAFPVPTLYMHFESMNGGTEAVFMLLCKDPFYSARVVHLDLFSGHSTELLKVLLPMLLEGLIETAFNGDFFTLLYSSLSHGSVQHPHRILVVNWRAGVYVLLEGSPTKQTDFAALPEHLILLHQQNVIMSDREIQYQLLLNVYEFSTLPWCSMAAISSTADWSRVQLVACKPVISIYIAVPRPNGPKMRVFSNPLRDSLHYLLTIYGSYDYPVEFRQKGKQPRNLKTSGAIYTFEFYAGRPATLRFISTTPAVLCHKSPSITLSGYATDPTFPLLDQVIDARMERKGNTVDDEESEEARTRVVVPWSEPDFDGDGEEGLGKIRGVKLGAYNAAVLTLYETSLKIQHYA